MMKLQDLKQPFEPNDIEFRAGATTGDDNNLQALALPYITSRAVMDRLDDVIGPENWKDIFEAGPSGGVICGISIRINDEWVTKWDGADNTNFEAVKGGLADSFKRAGVKWGIGRYLYTLPNVWVKAKKRGKSVILNENEARHKLFGTSQKKEPSPIPQQPPKSPTNGKAKPFKFPSQAAKNFYDNMQKMTQNGFDNGFHFVGIMKKLDITFSVLNNEDELNQAIKELSQYVSNKRDEKAAQERA